MYVVLYMLESILYYHLASCIGILLIRLHRKFAPHFINHKNVVQRARRKPTTFAVIASPVRNFAGLQGPSAKYPLPDERSASLHLCANLQLRSRTTHLKAERRRRRGSMAGYIRLFKQWWPLKCSSVSA